MIVIDDICVEEVKKCVCVEVILEVKRARGDFEKFKEEFFV